MWGLEDLTRINEEEVKRRDLRNRRLAAEVKAGAIAQSHGDVERRDNACVGDMRNDGSATGGTGSVSDEVVC